MCNLEDYKKYMLTKENITNFLPQKKEQNLNNLEMKTESKIVSKQRTSNFKQRTSNFKQKLDNQSDTLFWCFYIILKGEHEYELNKSFTTEKEFKIQSIEQLRTIKPQLKALKLKINETEGELLTAKKITVKSLVALCLLHKKNLLYVWDHKYYEFINNADEPVNIIIWNKEENNFSHIIDDEKQSYYTNNYWCVQNIDKPLKSMTGYSRDELLEIVKKLDIQIINKETKKGLYEKILEKM